MRMFLSALLALTLLAACQNTRAGIQQDASRMGEKAHQIGDILTTP